MAQRLNVSDEVLAGSFITRGIWLAFGYGRRQSCAYYREAARLAERAGNGAVAGRAFLNLADSLSTHDPMAGVDAARTAAGHLRRTGDRDGLTFALTNLAAALVAVGDWEAADDVLGHGLEIDGLSDRGPIAIYRVWLAGLRGDTRTAASLDLAHTELQESEDPQDQTIVGIASAFVADAEGRSAEALGSPALFSATPRRSASARRGPLDGPGRSPSSRPPAGRTAPRSRSC